MRDADIVLADMREHGSQFSWDWQADLRFAEAVGDEAAAEMFDWLINRGELLPRMVQFYNSPPCRPLHQRRLRALRQLIKEGLVVAHWMGTGPCGFTDLGINRSRCYDLKD